MESLRPVEGFHCCACGMGIKTIIGYDLNLPIEITANVCLP